MVQHPTYRGRKKKKKTEKRKKTAAGKVISSPKESYFQALEEAYDSYNKNPHDTNRILRITYLRRWTLQIRPFV